MTNPKKPGYYLLLVYEWVGLPRERPAKPEWFRRHWNGSKWQRIRYEWDTGLYENFEPVMWAPLPEVPEI